ncbi:ABC transporter permease subunit, partial [Vibrio breoganii]
AIYLTEYAKVGSRLVKVIRFCTESLAGIPSIIFGLFGMTFFVSILGLGFSILSGALTLSILILPVIIRTTEEALMAVPQTYREGSYGLGASKIYTI